MALNINRGIEQLSAIAAGIAQLGNAPESLPRAELLSLTSRLQTLADELKTAADDVSASQKQEQDGLSRFASNAPGYFYILVLHPDGRWTVPFASEGIRDIFGLEPGAIVDDVTPIMALSHPDDLEMTVQEALASARDLTPYHVEYRIRHPHKGERWIECRSLPQREKDGGTRWNGFMHDITDRKRTENTLRFIAQREGLTETEDFLAALARHLGETLHVDYVVIDLLADEPDTAQTAALYAKGGIVPNMRYPLAGTPCAQVMGRKLCCFPQDVQARFPADALLADMGVESYAGIPLWDSAGKAIGLIAVMDGKPMADGAAVTHLLQLTAPAASAALERQRSERALRESEQQFRTLAENLPDNVARWDCTGRYLYVNPTHARTLRVAAADIVGKSIDRAAYPEVAGAIDHVVATGAAIPFTRQPVLDEQGNRLIHEVCLIPERNADGVVVSVLGIGRDVTEQASTQAALEASERQFRSLTENLPDNVVRWDCEGRFLYVNPSYERLAAKPADAIVGTRLPSRSLGKISRAVTGGVPLRLPREIVTCPDGSTQIHEVDIIPERNAEGEIISVLGIGRDVTSHMRTQEALMASERHFRSLAENLPDNVARWDCEGRFLYVNPTHARLLGKSADELVGMPISRRLLPDVLTVAATGIPRRIPDHLIPDPEGEVRIHEIDLIPERNELCEVTSVLGLGRDITGHVRMQEALADRERQFRTLAENLPNHLARYSADARIVYFSPKLERLLGVRFQDIVGMTPQEAWPDGRFAQYQACILDVARTGEGTEMAMRATNEKGEPAIFQLQFVPERDQAGVVTSVLSISHDVTERTRFQEALEASERQFRSLAENLPNNVARYTPDARLIYANPTLERTLGKPQAEVLDEPPSERWPPGIMDDYEACILEVGRSGEAAVLEKYLPYADGQFGWFHFQFVAERDESGAIASVLVISDDVTERKRAEADMRLVASVFEASSEGILITDLEGNILKANPACVRITGFALDGIIGKNPFRIDAGRHGAGFYTAIWSALHTYGTWSGEIDNRRPNGELFTMRTSISAVRDSRGAVMQYVVIFSDISQFKQHELQLEYIAHHDTLTGLPNRILLIDRLQQGIAQMRRSRGLLAVLFIDLDGFKPINDRLGHQAGDETLVEMGRRMVNNLRATDTVARIGGDEFVILLPGLSDIAECELSTRRLLKAVAEPIEVAGYRFTLSASIGIALYPNDADDADTLLRCADEAMYTAKRTGRSQYVLCSSDVRHGFRFDGSSVHDLRLALEQDQIEVYYQPIIDFNTGEVAKAEALVRWRHPERGLVPPAEFIPIAEDTGLIHAIGTRVFGKALDTAQAWHRLCPNGKPRRISVNRSPREFLDPDGVDSWMELLHGKGAALGQMLSVEITEGLLLDDRPKVLEQLKQLRSMGMTIALDDFGTGFSSLAYLKKFAIDYLKIDRSFVLDIEHDPSDRVIVESVIAMARHLGIRLIAEGVENEAQARLLAAARCDYAQGYLYARPLPEAEFLAFVAKVREQPLPVPRRLQVSAA